MEKEFDVMVFDMSLVPNRTLERQVETTAGILNSLLKTKKPVVLATTKNEEGNEIFIREAERLLNKKEFKAFFQGELFSVLFMDIFRNGCTKCVMLMAK